MKGLNILVVVLDDDENGHLLGAIEGFFVVELVQTAEEEVVLLNLGGKAEVERAKEDNCCDDGCGSCKILQIYRLIILRR